MAKIEMYTDGACSGNPGVGGWAAILIAFDDSDEILKKLPLSGCMPNTTIERMALLAAIKGLQALTQPTSLTVYSSSDYLIKTITQGWKRNKNQDLWAELEQSAEGHEISWQHIRLHSGNEYNEESNKRAANAKDDCFSA